MKKTVIVCDKCHKEFEEETTAYATIITKSGTSTSTCDICGDCWHKIFNKDHQTVKGGEKR